MNNGDRWADYRHEGKVFIATHNVITLGSGESRDMLIRVPDSSNVTALIQAEISDYMNSLIYESPVVGNVGTTVTPRNMNRSYGDDTDVLFFHTPTIISVGTLLYDEFSLAWLGYFNEGTGVWDLKKGTDYLLRANNLSEDAGYLKWRIVFRKITVEERIT